MNGLGGTAVKIEVWSLDGLQRTIEGEVGCFTSRWLFLDAQEQILPSTVVSVNRNDCLLSGEVLACEASKEGTWRLKVQVEHQLTNLKSLMNLRRALLAANSHISSSLEKAHL